MPDKIEIAIGPSQIPDPTKGGRSSLIQPITMVASVVFANFYEMHKDWIESDQGFKRDATSWPPIINFARVVRNAVSHSGKLHFSNPNAPAVEWRERSYSPTNHGTPVIGPDMAYADLLILMIDMSDELDRYNAPMS